MWPRLVFGIVSMFISIALTALPVSAEVRENDFGKSDGYPYANGWPFRTIPKFRHGALTGKGLDELASKVSPFWLAPADSPSKLPTTVPEDWVYREADQLMDQNTILAMLLIKNGAVVFERYQYQTSESTLFDSQSIAKTLTALYLGALSDEGLLPSLETKIGDIVPEISASPIALATLRQTLQMQCGHEFKWVDDGAEGSAGKYARVKFAGQKNGAKNLYDYFATLPPARPGDKFSYDPHCSDALSMVINKITKKSLRENFEQTIWRRLGPERRAAWLSPTLNQGLTSGANSFYASLRDWGRLALLFVSEGAYGSVQLVSRNWLKAMHTDKVPVGQYPSNFFNYGYQTWVRTPADNSWYAGLGNYGQRFYIDPASRSAMVLFALDESHIRTSDRFWEKFRR
jgi:CubicO group peptidase (beta-lactamase class C family)